MKRIAIAAAFCLGASVASAQAPETPKHKCEPKPEFPGRIAMQSERSRNAFQREVKNYEACMKAFVEERKAIITVNTTAVNAAIAEYNATVSALNKAQQDAQ